MRFLSRLFCVYVIGLCLLMTACGSDSTAVIEQRSAWGKIITIAQAEQSHAPALGLATDNIITAWVGADETGIFQYARRFTVSTAEQIQPLPIPPVYPYAQSLLPAFENGYVHLVWLDARYDDIAGGTRLWTVVLSPELIPTRGAVQVSDVPTLRYTLLTQEDGGFQAIYSGGLPSEPSLYAQAIDPLGRPRPVKTLVSDADWPCVVRINDGSALLFWLRYSDGQVFRAQLVDETLEAVTSLGLSLRLMPGDLLTGFNAGLDTTHAYLLWNVQRLGGANEVWMAVSPLAVDDWTEPQRLGISTPTDDTFTTGFNGGAAQTVTSGDQMLRWAAPLAGQGDSLVLAAQIGDKLSLVYLRGGEIVAVQEVVTLAQDLIGFPALYTDRDRHFYLAWSQPTDAGTADLNLTTTKVN